MKRRWLYLSVFVGLLIAASADAQVLHTEGGWTLTQTADPIDDTRTVRLTVSADEPMASVSLVADCDPDELGSGDVYISWGKRITTLSGEGTQTVTHRFPPTPAEETNWKTYEFLPSVTISPAPRAFLRTLVKAEGGRLIVRTVTIPDIITATFDLEGANATVAAYAEVCGWSLEVLDPPSRVPR